jgi:hypothetical protein
VTLLVCALLAAAPAIVEGRVGEESGAAAVGARVTLRQGERIQELSTGADGRFRFLAFEGPGVLTVRLPAGWSASSPLTREVGPAYRGDVLKEDFAAVPRRVLRGRLLVAGSPLPDARLSIGTATAQTDDGGQFVLEGIPKGTAEVRVDAPPLAGHIELPAGACDLSHDVGVPVPQFSALSLTRLPQPGMSRAIADWIASKPLEGAEVAALERLAALVQLDPAFRLAMVAANGDAAAAARAATVLQRYLTGPALVPRDRLVFSVAEFARPGALTVVLTRLEEPR